MSDGVVRLVESTIETGQPNAILNQLITQSRKLLREQIPIEVVREALREWDSRPGIPPSFLAHIVSDVLRSKKSSGSEEKLRDWESRLQEEMGD